jgi:DNA-binding transcriptional regulator PaaX
VDPNLPVELLPEGWPGMKAERLFEDYRLLLAGQAERFVESAMESPNGWELTARRRRRARLVACVA